MKPFFFWLALSIVMPAAANPTYPNADPLPERLRLEAPLNGELSPYTGYTRDHWLEITERLIAGFLPFFDAQTGLPDLSGAPESGHYAQLYDNIDGAREAFDRSLVMVGFYVAATGRVRVAGYDGSITEPYLRQIRRGTDPEDPWYWGNHGDYEVKGTNFAFIAQVCPEAFWEPFNRAEQDQILRFLQGLTRNRAFDNNHWYFHMTPVPLLERYGMASNRAFLNDMFERILAWYHGDGWFLDGSNKGFDYYNLWGFQLFNHMLVHLDPEWRALFGERIRETTLAFEGSLPYLFGRDGAPVPFGRSLPYRFAVNSAIGYAQLSGFSGMDPGLARRMASGVLRYFWENGALGPDGLLEPGWHGPNTAMAEPYTDRGSPYWAAHGLVPLLLPPDHPFWTATEAPMPADGTGGRVPLHGPEMLLQVRPDGDARLYPAGQHFTHRGAWQRGIKYAQLAYSSSLGFCVTGEGGPDLGAGRNGFSWDGEAWHFRAHPRMREVGEAQLSSIEAMTEPEGEAARPWFRDHGRLFTHTLVGDHGEVHVFWHSSATPVHLHLGGYGIAVPHGDDPEVDAGSAAIALTGGGFHSVMRLLQGPPGSFHHDHLEPRPGWQHSHLFGGRGAFPYWRSSEPVPSNVPVVCWVDGGRGDTPKVPDFEIHRGPGKWMIRMGESTFEIPVPY